MSSDFIHDGYTEAGYVKELNGFYGEHRFTYRPVTTQERAPVSDALKGRETDYNRMAADLCANKLVDWDIDDPRSKKPVAISAANLLRLRPALFSRIADVVMGWAASDDDPRTGQHDGLTGVEREGQDAKNSSTG